MSYNILDGGIGRADPIAEVILAQQPDVVGLVEADDADVLDRIAWRLGFDCVAAVGRDGRTSALLTAGEILQSINRVQTTEQGRDVPKSWLEARVAVDAVELSLVVLHLTAHAGEADEQQREREISTVLETHRDLRDNAEPHVLMGDFNANSPHQVLVPERLPEKSRKYWDKNGGQIPRRVIEQIERAGYIDTLHHLDPPAAAVTATFTTREPGQRLDYLFTHGIDPQSITNAWVEQDRLATFASDHYPVGLEFQLTR